MTTPKATPRAGRPNQPLPPSGRPTSGRIVRIHAGQSHGFILDADSREVFFHRSDTSWGTFNTLLVGDTVAFELIEDRVSGPRATAVRRGKPVPIKSRLRTGVAQNGEAPIELRRT